MNLKEQAELVRNGVNRMVNFADKYSDAFGEEGNLTLNGLGETKLAFHIYESNHERLLALVGEVFSKDGWIKQLNYNNIGYLWNKVVDEVKVIMYNVENLLELV